MKYIWRSHFPEAITTNMYIGNDFFVFIYPVTCKNVFPISYFFIKINVHVCLLSAHPVMTNIILHIRRPVNRNSVTHFVLMFQLIDFSHFEELNRTFYIPPFRPTRCVLKRYRYLDVSNCVRNSNNVKTSFPWGRNIIYCQLETPIFIYKFCARFHL